ncbi:flagellin [Kosakonia sp. ML.JS2a]|uniref:flagellin N-terminal helical domain-containing protein n=1 Tax=Kosakonia sp. ML.JS2a TaxID=2980557 RepID=UPI0021DA9C85|nr:flagellin [Kosakonia sp. ML.JS2a]UXY09122.1 flagellin [Kosakonia sp. ML.JS2a]
MQAINYNEMTGLNLTIRPATASTLQESIERLSSGLRINSARDDAAGQAIANRMRASANADSVVSRGLDDAISMAQTADSSLSTVGELLIRAKNLAIQAGNSTLSEGDRQSTHNEYQSILENIQSISEGTEIFGRYPLATDDPELPPELIGNVPPLSVKFPAQGVNYTFSSGIVSLAYIPAGSKNIAITIDSLGLDDDIQLFTRDGKHLAGTPINGTTADYTWKSRGITSSAKATSKVLTEANGFQRGATYDDSMLIEGGASWALNGSETLAYNGMTISYSGDGDRYEPGKAYNDGSNGSNRLERLKIDNVTEDLVVMVVGSGSFTSNLTWGDLPEPTITPAEPPKQSRPWEVVTSASYGDDVQATTMPTTPSDIKSLGLTNTELRSTATASIAMGALDKALDKVSSYRAQYGAFINRFESNKSVLAQQSIATQAAKSRIEDADYAMEASKLVKAQILQQGQDAVLKVTNQSAENMLSLLRG